MHATSLVELHRRQGFDLIHAHWIVPQGLVAAALVTSRAIARPLLLTSHGGDLHSLSGGLFNAIKRWVVKRADSVNVVSQSMVKPCIELGLERTQIFVRSMGVDLRSRFTSQTSFEQRQGIVFVGRLVEKKGVEYLLKAHALLPERNRPQLSIAGHGPLAEGLERLAQELGSSRDVSFLGAVPNSELPVLLNRSRLAVVPSVIAADGDQEGLGLVAVEAMGCGCAVIASDLAALRDVIEDQKNGLMVPPADPVALAAALSQLLANDQLCSELASAGNRSVEKFAWDGVGRQYTEHYRHLMLQYDSLKSVDTYRPK